jgi:short-subunit dehydrogenase
MKILITGASSGIGAEFAREYAKDGNELILLARRADKLYDLRKELYESCKSVDVIVVDVRDTKKLQEKIKELDNVDMLILNAGISLNNNTDDIPSIDEFKNLYEVNLFSNHAILEIMLPKLKEQNSSKIVFVSSMASLISMPSATVYASSKRALNAYAQGIRYKYSKFGIKVITLAPGFIKSELTDKNEFDMPFILETKDGVKKMIKAIEKDKEFYIFPFRFYLIIKFLNIFPSFLRVKIVNSLK